MKLERCQHIDAELAEEDESGCMVENCTKEADVYIAAATMYYSDVYLCREHAVEFRDELNSANGFEEE
jgi:hypothetical protein